MKYKRSFLLFFMLLLVLTGCGKSGERDGAGVPKEDLQYTSSEGTDAASLREEDANTQYTPENAGNESPDPDGTYDSRDDVAIYLHEYGNLPSNYITKKEAKSLGWEGGSVEQVAPGKCIGGDRFGNYEELLPDNDYKECDIDTLGKKSRGAKRIIFSDDGDIYYTDDHYASFKKAEFSDDKEAPEWN